MPIAAGSTDISTLTFGGATALSYDARNYSHSTMVLASALNESVWSNMNIPPLTTIYSPSPSCADRWMLAGTNQVVTTYVGTVATLATTTRRIPTTNTTVLSPSTDSNQATTSALGLATTTAENAITSSAALAAREIQAQQHTVFSMDLNGTATDPSYRACQRYNAAPTYSPGVCPEGQTVAEITAWHVNASSGGIVTGYHTFWQASCCRRCVHDLSILAAC
jgi:hypothetical protein